MLLKKLEINNYKSIVDISLDFSDDINFFFGNNGIGKTNLLDAIYYLSFCKSYNSSLDKQNITHHQEYFSIKGLYTSEHTVYCAVSKSKGKVVKHNSNTYSKLSDHIGSIPLIIICPHESEIISGISQVRRKFIDGAIAQCDPIYLNNIINYKKALQQRNLCLKNFKYRNYFDETELEIWNKKLLNIGTDIYNKRTLFLDEFIPIFKKIYTLISNVSEDIDIVYKSDFKDNDFSLLLKQSLEKDRKTTFSNVGIHKDDLLLMLKGFELKKIGSQGQQKSVLIALKIAQLKLIKTIKKTSPILLLDDIYDKLDAHRMEQVIHIIRHEFKSQVFITDTDQARIPNLLEKNSLKYKSFQLPFK